MAVRMRLSSGMPGRERSRFHAAKVVEAWVLFCPVEEDALRARASTTSRGIRAKGPARKVADVEESPLAALGMGNEKVYEDIAAVANACDLDQSCDPRRRSQYIFAGNIISRTIDFGILA